MNRREILFRGKRMDGKGWVYGLPTYLCDKSNNENGNIFKDCYFSNGKDGSGLFKILPDTIGQFTGLTDSKGNKVFEGDIVVDEALNKGVVVWLTDAAQFLCDFGMDYHGIGTWATVIGNQFDTPELIQQS